MLNNESQDKPQTSLYVDNFQENQVFPKNEFKILMPDEISSNAIEQRFQRDHHPYADNKKFILLCTKFVNLVYNKQVLRFGHDNGQFVPLASNILKSKFGSNSRHAPLYYKYIILSLKDIGLIEVDENYFANNGSGKSKGYRVIILDPSKAVPSVVDDDAEYLRIDDYDHYHEIQRIQLDGFKFMFLTNLLTKPEKDQAFMIYHNWINNNHFIRVDDSGRIHTWLTQMPRELRCCFTYQTKPLYEIDLHACQPFLFLIAVKEHLNYGKHMHNKKSLEGLIQQYSDLKEYVERIQDGRFYEHLYRLHNNIKKAPVNKVYLNNYKLNLFKNLFFSDIQPEADMKKTSKIFSETYPTVFRVLNEIKNEEGYKSIARRLQKYESEVINETIARLKSVDSNELFLRFHDAILCRQEKCSLVSEILQGVLLKTVDVQGNLKENEWGTPFDSVLRSLRLDLFTLIKKHRFENAVGKMKYNAIKKIMAGNSLSADEKQKKWMNYTFILNNDVEKMERMQREYTTFAFTCPNQWVPDTVKAFKSYSLEILEDQFSKIRNKRSDANNQFASFNLNRFRQVLAA